MSQPTATRPAAQPAKAAQPAAQPRKESDAAKASRTAPVDVDFGKLEFAPVAAPVRKPSRTRDREQYAALIRAIGQSWEAKVPTDPKSARDLGFKPTDAGKLVREIQKGKGMGLQVAVADAAADKLVASIRTATNLYAEENDAQIGVTITRDSKDGRTTVKFAAKNRRQSHKDEDSK
jgi:hypothetical protein